MLSHYTRRIQLSNKSKWSIYLAYWMPIACWVKSLCQQPYEHINCLKSQSLTGDHVETSRPPRQVHPIPQLLGAAEGAAAQYTVPRLVIIADSFVDSSWGEWDGYHHPIDCQFRMLKIFFPSFILKGSTRRVFFSVSDIWMHGWTFKYV